MAIPGRLNITAGCVTISMIIPAYNGRSPTHWIYLGRPQGNLSIQRRCGLLPTSHGRVSPTLLTLPITSLRTLRASLTLPRPERTQNLGNFGWLFGAGGDFSGIPVRVRPRVRVPTLGDAPDGGPQLGGVLTQYTARVAEHRVDVLSERDSAAPSSLAWCRDVRTLTAYGT